jgi:hypothetical protein
LGEFCHLNYVKSSNPQTWDIFPFYYICLLIIFYSFLVYKLYMSLVYSYEILYYSRNEIVLFSAFSLLIYKNTTDFCILILLNLFISSSDILLCSLRIVFTRSHHLVNNTDIFILFIIIVSRIILQSFKICKAKTNRTRMRNR